MLSPTKAWPGTITEIPKQLVRAHTKLYVAMIMILPSSVCLPIRSACLTKRCVEAELIANNFGDQLTGTRNIRGEESEKEDPVTCSN